MEESVTKKFVHEESTSVLRLCGNLFNIIISYVYSLVKVNTVSHSLL